MGKGLIGNSLSYTMSKILKREVSAEDIDKIYAGTCFDENTISEIIRGYNYYWQSAATDIAEEEICKKYEVEDILDLKVEENYKKVRQELFDRANELLPGVITEAETLLHQLWDEGKIIQIRYIVPEGQKVKAKILPGQEYYYGTSRDELELEGESNTEIIFINGEYYLYHDNSVASLGKGSSELFNNELELIAHQLQYCSSDSDTKTARLFFLKKMFPQYKDAIEQVGEKLDWKSGMEEVLVMLKEELKQKEEHTVEEIGEGIEDLTQGEIDDALNAITDMREPEKESHTLE